MEIPIVLYHEPDVDWWVKERAADWNDFNSIDIVSCYLQIRRLGGTSVELVTTHGKGFDAQGNRQPHSWSIVTEPDLVRWIVDTVKKY